MKNLVSFAAFLGVAIVCSSQTLDDTLPIQTALEKLKSGSPVVAKEGFHALNKHRQAIVKALRDIVTGNSQKDTVSFVLKLLYEYSGNSSVPILVRNPGFDFDKIASGIQELQIEAAKSFSMHRKETVTNLIGIVEGSTNREARLFAFKLLGEYRAEEAVPVLIDNLDFDIAGHRGGLRVPSEVFPVRYALIAIGKPAVTPLNAKIKDMKNDYSRNYWSSTIVKIEGLEVAKFLFNKAIEKEELPERKANLKAALDYISTIKPDDEFNYAP